ncbi:hypothetical protein EMCRGX_G020397 [Ephydatia muelleri]
MFSSYSVSLPEKKQYQKESSRGFCSIMLTAEQQWFHNIGGGESGKRLQHLPKSIPIHGNREHICSSIHNVATPAPAPAPAPGFRNTFCYLLTALSDAFESYDTLALASLRANMTIVGLMVAPKIQLKSVRSMQRNTPGLLDRRIGPKDMFIVLFEGLALLCIESELAKTIDYDSIIATFASRKDRKAALGVPICFPALISSNFHRASGTTSLKILIHH